MPKHQDDADPRRFTVMIVDDVRENRDLLAKALDGQYRVEKAEDGESALLAMEENPPDLALLDVGMPGMDGFELARIVKVSPLLSEIPVIFITGLDDIGNKSKGFALGGEGAQEGFLKLAEVIAWTHHEKWDGAGYPRGLAGKRIPLVGCITAVADVFDALICRRPYKEPFPVEKALNIIREGAGSLFGPRVADAFFSVKDEILGIMEEYGERGREGAAP